MNNVRNIGLIPAILININVIIGSGIFINLYPFLSLGGTGSFVVYGVAALFLLPVVAVLAHLARRHPESGGLYVYVKNYVHPYVGFLCGWGYFVGKAVSVGLMAHILVLLGESLVPFVTVVPHIALVTLFLTLLACANIAGASLQGVIQWLFITAKGLPVLLVVGLLAYHGVSQPLSFGLLDPSAFANLVPIAVYAMIGFEVTCSIAHLFVRPQYTIMRVFVYGFCGVVAILSLFQYAVGALVPRLVLTVVPNMPAAPMVGIANAFIPGFAIGATLLTTCVYLSVLGGTFSILTSNCWNLHRLAVQGHLPAGRFLSKLTARNVPWVCLLVEVVIAVIAVGITDQQVSLQKMSILGVVFAFWCAVLAAIGAKTEQGTRLVHPAIVGVALISTTGFIGMTIYQIYMHGVSLPYVALVGVGVLCATWYEIRGRKTLV